MSIHQEKLKEINQAALELTKGIQILGPIAWPLEVETNFLRSWHANSPVVPTINYSKIDHTEIRQNLSRLLPKLSKHEPMQRFTRKTIESYIDATHLMESIGKPAFQELSVKLYGKPGNTIPGTKVTSTSAAKKIIRIAHGFEHPFIREPEICVLAEGVKEEIERGAAILGKDAPEIRILPDFTAKAAAGMNYVKLRQGTCFSKYDGKQLLVHEVLTHSLTAINGSKQPILSLLARGGPRTTATQEGLATFSEVITGSMDLKRLIRLALRILAIDKALNGADFIDIFKFFLKHNQSEKESFRSAARIFRGGNPKGGCIFTKDNVYLDGLFHVYAMFQWALHENRPLATHLMFCGRLDISDIFMLEQSLAEGQISQPCYLPPWYENIECLAGNLAFSLMNTLMELKDLVRHFHESYVHK